MKGIWDQRGENLNKHESITEREEIQRAISDYWDLRAKGYSIATMISLDEDESLLRSMQEFVNLKRKMRILDVGTGAGLVAIMMSCLGHEVVAMDESAEMLEHAKKNASIQGVNIEFIKGDAHKPQFEDNEFDMVIAKDTIWSLRDPPGAYSEWERILKPGGYLMVIDGNYYLDLYDEDYRKRKEYFELKNGPDASLHAKTNVDNVNMDIIRDIARKLPMSHVRRPGWDVSFLLGLGFTDIQIRSLDKLIYSVFTENGLMKLPSKFIICARSTPDVQKSVDSSAAGQRLKDEDVLRMNEIIAYPVGPLRSLADTKRLRIISALRPGSLNVNQICIATGYSQSLISHDLKMLRDAGIVISEKEGKNTFYSLSDTKAIDELFNICNAFADQSEDINR